MPRVLICDDAVAFAVLFRRWMRGSDIDVVGHASTARDAVALARGESPDVIVVDHLLPDALSPELVPRLRTAAPDARVLLISSLPAADLTRAAEEAGADAHMSKAATPELMQQTIRGLVPPE